MKHTLRATVMIDVCMYNVDIHLTEHNKQCRLTFIVDDGHHYWVDIEVKVVS